MDLKNLVYNGDFENGNAGWSGGTVTVDSKGNYLTASGSIQQSQEYAFPVATNRKYRISFDVKFDVTDGNYFYLSLYPLDSSKEFINITTVNNPMEATSTLAADLKSGDTTVTIANASGWDTNHTYQRIGICDLPAYGYNRCRESYPYASVSGNVLTLKSAYSGSTIPTGTKVAGFRDGSWLCYPIVIASSNQSSEWTTHTVDYYGGDSIRYSAKYAYIYFLSYGQTYSIRNVRIECISDLQTSPFEKKDFKVLKNGVASLYGGDESGMYIRYIRTTTAGSTANAGNHLCEIQALNSVGENIAWNKLVNGSRDVRTDGNPNAGSYVSTATHTLDLEFPEYIHKIKLWYYYADGRTYYDKKVEVSLDGTNWIEVYSGEKPEISDGLEIILHPEKFKINKNGTIYSRELYEF